MEKKLVKTGRQEVRPSVRVHTCVLALAQLLNKKVRNCI